MEGKQAPRRTSSGGGNSRQSGEELAAKSGRRAPSTQRRPGAAGSRQQHGEAAAGAGCGPRQRDVTGAHREHRRWDGGRDTPRIIIAGMAMGTYRESSFLSLVFLTANGSTAQRLTKVASLPFFWLRAAPPRRRLAACAAARLTQAGPRVERAGQPALGALASPVGAGAAWMSSHGANGSPRSLREPPRPSRAVDVRRRRGARRAAPGLLSARGGRGGPSESPAARGGSCAAATSAAISPVWLARGGSPRRFAGSAVRSCRRRSR